MWMTPQHESGLNQLTPFQDEMNLLLSMKGVAINLLRIFWKRKDIPHLSPLIVLENKDFSLI